MTDWIRTRAKCNTRALFDQLKKVVQAHVDAANANIPSHRFTIDDKSLAEIDDSLADGFVVRVDDVLQRAFRLEADGKTIDVVERGRFKDPSAPSFTACAVFIDDDCRLKVTQLRSEADEAAFVGVPDLCTSEDFSRRVLEPLFFPEP